MSAGWYVKSGSIRSRSCPATSGTVEALNRHDRRGAGAAIRRLDAADPQGREVHARSAHRAAARRVISPQRVEKISPRTRESHHAAKRRGACSQETPLQDAEALKVMTAAGLQVISLDAAAKTEFRTAANQLLSTLNESMVPKDVLAAGRRSATPSARPKEIVIRGSPSRPRTASPARTRGIMLIPLVEIASRKFSSPRSPAPAPMPRR